jgi:hypothetical protein
MRCRLWPTLPRPCRLPEPRTNLRLLFLPLVLALGCAHTVTKSQTYPDGGTVTVIGDEVDTSWRNSDPVISYESKPGAPGGTAPSVVILPGNSYEQEAMTAAQAASGAAPFMMGGVAAGKDKGIFSTDDWAQSVVNKLDGSVFEVVVPGLATPVRVVFHAPHH